MTRANEVHICLSCHWLYQWTDWLWAYGCPNPKCDSADMQDVCTMDFWNEEIRPYKIIS